MKERTELFLSQQQKEIEFLKNSMLNLIKINEGKLPKPNNYHFLPLFRTLLFE